MRPFHLVTAVAMMIASPVVAQDIGGKYTVEGTNLNGTTYSGTAEIVVTTETTCEIYWTTGGSTSQGICMRNGNAFSAGYVLGDAIGLVIYEVKRDGSMDGLWTVAGQNGTGTEKLTPR